MNRDEYVYVYLELTGLTHLSTLNDQLADAAHEHVFSLAVLLVAVQRQFTQDVVKVDGSVCGKPPMLC